MKLRSLFSLIALLLICSPLFAQTSPMVTPITMTATPVALPGGKTTVPGAETGMLLNITNNFSLRDKNLIAPGFEYFGGGFNYAIAPLSTALNNISPTLNGLRFQFYVTGSAGIDRISSLPNSPEHYAFTAGGGVNYQLTAGGMWSMGVEVEYAKFPGLVNNTAIVKLGPSIHF